MKRDVRLVETKFCHSEDAKRLWEQRAEMGWPDHLRPFSTLIAAMGNHWHPGCKEAVLEMARFTSKQGYDVTLYQEDDRCYQPYDGLGIMRNLAYTRAVREGYEYLLYLDNDVMPPPDALVKLLHRFVPVVCPRVVYASGDDYGLTMPGTTPNQGLALITSCVLSFVLFQTAVFLPWALTPFWQDAIGADEGYHFKKLAMSGTRPFLDTDVTVTCVSAPHFPFDGIEERKGRTPPILTREEPPKPPDPFKVL